MRAEIAAAATGALLTAAAAAATALEWPVAEPRVEIAFGQHVGETVARGVRLGSALATVRATANGEAIFVRDHRTSHSVPTTAGGLVVIAHRGELRSVYAGLSSTIDPAVDGFNIEMGAEVGTIGTGGAPASVYFSLLDTASRTAVNPAILLPPLAEAAMPSINELRVTPVPTGADARTEASASGAAAYHVDIAFGATHGTEAAYRAELVVDGRSLRVITLDSLVTTSSATLALSEGRTPVADVLPASGAFRFPAIDLRSGEHHLTVIVSSLSGARVVREEVAQLGSVPKETGR